MLLVSDMMTKKGDRIGDRKIKAITPVSARQDSLDVKLVRLGGYSASAPQRHVSAVIVCLRSAVLRPVR